MRAKLEDVCTVFSDGDWIESKDQSDKGIRLVQTGNIGEGLYLEKEERAKYVSEETFESLKCTEIYPGDILISRLPEPVGRACIIPPKKERMITAVDCTICRVDESIVSKEYMCYFMRSNAYYTKLLGSVTGTTRKRISRKNLGNIELEIPPKEEQIDVVSQLECLINVINSRNKELQLFDDLIKARFVEMFSKINVDWKEVTMADICKDMRTGPFGSALHHDEFVDKGIFVLGIDNAVENKFSYNRMRYITEEKYEKLKRYTVHPGDVIITIMGTVGRSAVIPENMPKAINTKHLACLTPDTRIVDSYFLVNVFQVHPLIRKQLESQSKGAIMNGLNLTIIKGLKFRLPPLELQKEFVKFYKQIDKSKVINQLLQKWNYMCHDTIEKVK